MNIRLADPDNTLEGLAVHRSGECGLTAARPVTVLPLTKTTPLLEALQETDAVSPDSLVIFRVKLSSTAMVTSVLLMLQELSEEEASVVSVGFASSSLKEQRMIHSSVFPP